MNRTRPIVAEALRALCVLALVFLNFGHTAAALPGDASIVAAAVSYCGDPLGDHPADHAPCHACRIGNGADLPPPPVAAVRADATVPVCFGAADVGVPSLAIWGRAQSRGPPAFV